MSADVRVENHGSIMVFQPLNPAASEWIEEHTGDETTWWAGGLVVEPRYAANLAAGMIADGLKVV